MRKRSKAVSLLFVLLFVFGTLVSMILSAIIIENRRGRAAFQKELARIKAEGLPTTLEEMNDWGGPPTDNASDFFAKAASTYVEPDKELKQNLPYGKVPFPKLGEPLPDNMRHAIQTHVTQNRESLEWLRRGTAVAECRQSEDHVDVGDREALKHFSKSWRGMDILKADALLSVAENRTDDALCAFLNCLAASNSHWRETLYQAHEEKARGFL